MPFWKSASQTLANTPNDLRETRGPSRFKIWLLAIRPKTLGAAVAPVMMGTAMAYGDRLLHWPSALVALFGALLIQIGTNLANDYFDFVQGADTGQRLGPTRVTQAGLVSPRVMRQTFCLMFVLAFLGGCYLAWRGGWPIVIIGLLSIALGILYSGGPFPLGYYGLGDFFVLIFFGPVAVGGTYYVQAQTIHRVVILAGLAPGLLATALLTVNNLRDIPTDRQAGKKTLAVRFGATFARLEYLLSILMACLLPVYLFFITRSHPYAMATLAVLILSFPAIRTLFQSSEGPVLNRVLARTGRLLLWYSTVFSVGWLI